MALPLENLVDGSSVGSCAISSSAAHAPVAPARDNRARSRAMLLIGLLARLDALLVFPFVDVIETHPREAHFVDGPLTVADPVARIRVVLVGRRVVVPRGDMDDRPGRQDWRDVVGVRVGDVPAELIVADAIDRFG